MPTWDQRKSEQKAGLSQSFLMYVWTLPVSQATVQGVASILTQVPGAAGYWETKTHQNKKV